MNDKTDREMLEYAAKAAGYEVEVDHKGVFHIHEGTGSQSWSPWNPLDDDGDNRRLQVDLKIELMITDQSATACFGMVFYSEPLGKDARKAARRAIVRAAADIGRGLK